MKTFERGDIDSISFGGHNGVATTVAGYQNYLITDSNVLSQNNRTSKRPWTDTKIKGELFDKVLKQLNPKTYVDFGSNLGYYVFRASQFNIDSTGIDYNLEYISICQAIKARHEYVSANFKHTNLTTWCTENDLYDFMTVFNVIHHLYNRTEQYQDMQRLIGDFASKSKNILFEVPTENDSKGHKWTMDTNYSEQLFVESANKFFNTVEHIPGQTKHRPYYLCLDSKKYN
jgi:hypothetical protein